MVGRFAVVLVTSARFTQKNQNTTLPDVLLQSLLASDRDKHSHAFNSAKREKKLKFSKLNRNGLVTARHASYFAFCQHSHILPFEKQKSSYLFGIAILCNVPKLAVARHLYRQGFDYVPSSIFFFLRERDVNSQPSS